MPATRLFAAFQHRSIRLRLLWLTFVTSLPLYVAIAWYIHHEIEMARQATFSKVTLMVRGVETHLNEILASHIILIKGVAHEFEGNPPATTQTYNPLQTIRLLNLVRAIGVRDMAGRALYTTATTLPDSVFLDSQWGKLALESDDVVISGLEPGHDRLGWSIYMTYPVKDAGGARTGFVYLEIDLALLNERVMKNIPNNILMPVVDAADHVLLRSAKPEVFIGTQVPERITKAG